ncbi:uncharacterized protein N7469_011332 [Penicillium citrinum]|uniref:Uncharacterized protein n=2 Tax=Penicillium TaxID=5073 RepID=A0A9W9ND62_PENCI|nr:uncharacterized protein N7469_011332 [Penicillium citrinum]KAJ5217707.1 hypothetical protein N7469_011332 [Penicillium citrinum]KAJ5575408.1 hypothetical protein N7450_009307 [Penicillium hetheringtonii]
MKSPPRPATVYELDAYGNPVLHSMVSAIRDRVAKRKSTPYTGNRAQHRPRESQDCVIGVSMRSGSLDEMVKACGQNPTSPMTIFTSHQDMVSESNGFPGCRYRKISFLDEVKVLDSSAIADDQSIVRLTAFITKNDEEHMDPKIYVEQRVYEGRHNKIIVHELAFGGRIQVDKEYVFRACGDEDRILGKRDLRLRIVSESFNSYLRGHTTYYGYDIIDYVYVDEESISKDLPHTVWRNISEGPYKVFLNGKDLQILLKAKQENRGTVDVLSGENIELLRLRFAGQGYPTEDKVSAGNLDVRVIYKPRRRYGTFISDV